MINKSSTQTFPFIRKGVCHLHKMHTCVTLYQIQYKIFALKFIIHLLHSWRSTMQRTPVNKMNQTDLCSFHITMIRPLRIMFCREFSNSAEFPMTHWPTYTGGFLSSLHQGWLLSINIIRFSFHIHLNPLLYIKITIILCKKFICLCNKSNACSHPLCVAAAINKLLWRYQSSSKNSIAFNSLNKELQALL